MLKIGFVSTETGSSALFGEANTSWSSHERYFGDHPVKAGGTEHAVEIVVKDTQSDSNRAGEVAAELINSDGVDLVLAVLDAGHRQPGRGAVRGQRHPVHHDGRAVAAVLLPRGRQARRPEVQLPLLLGPGGRLGGLPGHVGPGGHQQEGRRPVPERPRRQRLERQLPRSWRRRRASPSTTRASTRTAPRTSPPRSPRSRATTSWSACRSRRTSRRSGSRPSSRATGPKIATIAKALLFPSAVEALGTSADNLCTEVWWHPTAPFKRSLTGQTAQELADEYEDDTGKQWTQPLGFVHALFEVAVAAVTRPAAPTPRRSPRRWPRWRSRRSSATSTGRRGTVRQRRQDPAGRRAVAPDEGGRGEHPFDLVVVSNTLAPEIPTAARSSRSGEPVPARVTGVAQAVRPVVTARRRVVRGRARRGARHRRAERRRQVDAARHGRRHAAPGRRARSASTGRRHPARRRRPLPARDRPGVPGAAPFRRMTVFENVLVGATFGAGHGAAGAPAPRAPRPDALEGRA